ncbi:MAG: reverse transcriptase domain-containing protein [Pirellulales bacterium]
MTRSTSSYDHLYQPALLRRAWRLVQLGGPAGGVDAVNVDQFARRAGSELPRIADQLRRRQYCFQPVRRAKIKKPGGGQRTLGIPTIADRIVGQAVRLVIEPHVEPHLSAANYAYRPQRDAHRAIDKLLEFRRGGRYWWLESDVKDFFDSIVHRQLLRLLGRYVSDATLLDLVAQFLRTSATCGGGWFGSARGVPQGSPLSPLLSNLYLDPFDRALAQRGHRVIRYADDLVVCCHGRDAAESARREVARELRRWGLHCPGSTSFICTRTCGTIANCRQACHLRSIFMKPWYVAPGGICQRNTFLTIFRTGSSAVSRFPHSKQLAHRSPAGVK